MLKINRTFKTFKTRFIHTYDNTCPVVDVTFQRCTWFSGVLNTKKQLCSRSNMVEMVCSYADIVTENTNIAIRGRYSKYFIELFFLELFRRPFPVQDAQKSGSDCDHAQATNLRFNQIIIIELYDVMNISGQGFEKGDPGEKTVPRIEKYRKQQFRFEHAIFKQFHIKINKSLKILNNV